MNKIREYFSVLTCESEAMTVKDFYESCKMLGIEDYELRHINWYQDVAGQRPLDDQPLNLDDIQISDDLKTIKL